LKYNDVLGAMGILSAIGSHIKSATDKVYKPNTYVADPREQQIINELDNLKVSPQPAINAMYNADRVARYANNRSGDLSAE